MYQSTCNGSLGLAPVVATAPAFGPAAPFVAAGATVVSALVKIFGGGGVPYGQFEEEIAPILRAKARETGLSVFSFWYGEPVGVDANGQRVILPHTGLSVTDYKAILQQLANDVLQKIISYEYGKWVTYTPGSTVPTFSTPYDPTQAGFFDNLSPVAWAALAVGGIILVKGIGKK